MPQSWRNQPLRKQAAEHAASDLSLTILEKLTYACGKTTATAVDHDWYVATALAVRDRIVDRWTESNSRVEAEQKKHVYYLSVEYLIGRLLLDALTNLQLEDETRDALAAFDAASRTRPTFNLARERARQLRAMLRTLPLNAAERLDGAGER